LSGELAGAAMTLTAVLALAACDTRTTGVWQLPTPPNRDVVSSRRRRRSTMFRRLFGLGPSVRPGTIPAGQAVYAIGDVHATHLTQT
jgi:hypothetical protein